MTIQQFKDSMVITENIIGLYFTFEKTIIKDLSKSINCPICDSHHMNISVFRTEPWTQGIICNACKRVMFCYINDRMSGVHEDTIKVYIEKNPELLNQ